MSEMRDLTLDNLGAGLMCGLVSCGAPIHGWRMRSTWAHAAVEAIYRRLLDTHEWDLRFRIFLDPVYGTSPDWNGQVDRLLMQGWLSQSVPDGEFTVHVSPLVLKSWLDAEDARLPGGHDLWIECAMLFRDTYDRCRIVAH